jgi:hypothetical protein
MSLGSRGLARALAAGALAAVAFCGLADNSGVPSRPQGAVGGGAGLEAHIPRLPEWR